MKKDKKISDYTSIIVGVVATSAVVLMLVVLVTAKAKSTGEGTALASVALSGDWVKGNSESKVSLVEYSDFQCPACGLYYPLVKQLTAEFGDRIEFTYRHFPLSQIHPNADIAARAAEAAGKQEKFWEMHDKLFENQRTWSGARDAKKLFIEYAGSLGLNTVQFEEDMDSREVKEKVRLDYKTGIDSGVNSTPTFFLNGKKIINPKSYDEFKTIILAALEAQP